MGSYLHGYIYIFRFWCEEFSFGSHVFGCFFFPHQYKRYIYFVMVDVSSYMLSSPLFPFPWVILCLMIFLVFSEAGCVEGNPWSVCPWLWSPHSESIKSNQPFLGSLVNGVDIMQRTFLPRASSGSRCVEWGNLTTLQKVSNIFYLFLLWCSAPGRTQCVSHLGGSLSLPPVPFTYSPPHFKLLLPSKHLSCAHYDLALSLNVAFCLEQAFPPLPREHMFSFWVWEVSDTVLLFGSSTICFLRWPILDPLMDRVPSSEKTSVQSSRWTDRLMHHPKVLLTMVALHLLGVFTLLILSSCCIWIKAAN